MLLFLKEDPGYHIVSTNFTRKVSLLCMSKFCASIDRHGDEQLRQQMCSTLKEKSQSLNEPFKTYEFPT